MLIKNLFNHKLIILQAFKQIIIIFFDQFNQVIAELNLFHEIILIDNDFSCQNI